MSDYRDQQNQPIRASRDDVEHKPLRAEKPVSEPKAVSAAKAPVASSGKLFSGTNLLILMLFIIVVLSLGMTWKQSQEISELTGKFDALDNLIKSTDESLSQSGTALSLKIREQGDELDKHWTEIKKLWGVSYDRNRKAIEANQKGVEEAKSVANQAKSTANKQQELIAKSEQALAKLEGEIASISTSVRSLSTSNLATTVQLEEIDSRLSSIADLQQKLTGLSKRIADSESALKALDVYRSQVNQQLSQLRQKVDAAP